MSGLNSYFLFALAKLTPVLSRLLLKLSASSGKKLCDYLLLSANLFACGIACEGLLSRVCN